MEEAREGGVKFDGVSLRSASVINITRCGRVRSGPVLLDLVALIQSAITHLEGHIWPPSPPLPSLSLFASLSLSSPPMAFRWLSGANATP